jgi:UDP-N-acetylglucosamine 2-epimerase (non-hydrolysing)
MLITIIAGARPNFIKVAPIIRAIHTAKINSAELDYRLVHTGQHFDQKMSGNFFDQLNIPPPHINLHCATGSAIQQTASIMCQLESEFIQNKPDIVLVVGDVTSTMAAAITAKKMGIHTVHVEAGIRSGDLSMPEELNRMITDAICDTFFTTSITASKNLIAANIQAENIHFVGNTMIDTLFHHLHDIKEPNCWDSLQLTSNNYFLLTLHRPSNVDDPLKLQALLTEIASLNEHTNVVFPVHPRTRNCIEINHINTYSIQLIPPQPYLEFIYLIKHAKGIITDSGGITEEATMLNVPCITMRNSTERPETVTHGTNVLVGEDMTLLAEMLNRIEQGNWKSNATPALWDGKTSDRIVNILLCKKV